MKKLMIAVSMVAALFLTSCGGKQDANGFYTDFEAAKKTAQAKNKGILLFVNSDYDSDGSDAGVKAILSKDFTSALKNDFVFVHFAFTDMQNVLGDVNKEISSKEQKALENRKKLMMSQFKYADTYAVKETPAIVLLNKDGYYASELECEYTSETADGYVSLVKNDEKYISIIDEMVEKTKKGSTLDRVNAIVNLHDSMAESYRLAMLDLVKKAVQMDKKNASESMDKLLYTLAYGEAYDYMVTGEFSEAGKIIAKYAADPRLTKELAQEMFYYAAECIGKNRKPDLKLVRDYLEKAVTAAPDSENAAQIQQIIDQIDVMTAAPSASTEAPVLPEEQISAPAAESEPAAPAAETK